MVTPDSPMRKMPSQSRLQRATQQPADAIADAIADGSCSLQMDVATTTAAIADGSSPPVLLGSPFAGNSCTPFGLRSLSAARQEARAERSPGHRDIAAAFDAMGLRAAALQSSPTNGGAGGEPRSLLTGPSRRGQHATVAPVSPGGSRRAIASTSGQIHPNQNRTLRGSHVAPPPNSSTASRRPMPFAATPRAGGGSIRSPVGSRTGDSAMIPTRGTRPVATSPSLRTRGTRSPCNLRSTSMPPAHFDSNALHSHTLLEPPRSDPIFERPQRARDAAPILAANRSLRVPTRLRSPMRVPGGAQSPEARSSLPQSTRQADSQTAAQVLRQGMSQQPTQSQSTADASVANPSISQKIARVEQMNAVAQSLQAAALALQRVSVTNPSEAVAAQRRVVGAARTSNGGGAGEGERDATVARLAGAAQRVRADWVGSESGTFSQLTRENAALRDALNDTTRKLSALEEAKMRTSSAPNDAPSPLVAAANATEVQVPRSAAVAEGVALAAAAVARAQAATAARLQTAQERGRADARAALVEAVGSL